MRVPWSWLRSYCEPGLGPDELAERLSMTGTEVERIGHSGAPDAAGFVVGRVLGVDDHPDADRLRVCAVDVGEGEQRTIVCGAPNVAAGQAVAVALPGAVLAGGQRLGPAKLRGVSSHGMILSEVELEAGENADGIVVLETDAAPGSPLQHVVPVAEPVLELEITPNRPDCLGVWGIAREAHAITGAELAPEPWRADAAAEGEGEVSDYASVRVEAPELCPRFTARVFTDVEIGPSPLWLKQRLIAAGQRPINNVVDITNYVMLLTAQPLHAFDLGGVPGGELIVRRAVEGETMTTLDGVERRFDSEAMLVCDREGPSGIAGIMGGERSEVAEATTRVLLEVATWSGPNILTTSGKLGLRSEASTRFEKQLHPELTLRAQRIASRLLVEHCGAKLVPGTIDVAAGGFEPHRLELDPARATALLGMEIESPQASAYLDRLGFGTGAGEGAIAVEVPADRHFDVTREVDLIEEVARVHGLDEHLPATLPDRAERLATDSAPERSYHRPAGVGGLARHQALLRRAEDVLRGSGFDEVVSWSFVAPEAAERLAVPEAKRAAIAIHNPLSEEQSRMRTTLLGGLLDAASYNLARGAGRASLFESGRVYLPQPPPEEGGVLDGSFTGTRPAPACEPHRLGGVIVAPLAPASWREEASEADFFVGKGVVELLCAALRAELDVAVADRPWLHPGRAAELLVGGVPAGWLGELHPAVAAQWDLPGGVAFELGAGPLIAAAAEGRERFEDVTTYPAVYEDLAVSVPQEIPAAAVRQAVTEGAGELLRRAEVFDVYEGEQAGEDRRSLALRLEFRAADRTLTDAEVGERREAIVGALEEIGGSLRV